MFFATKKGFKEEILPENNEINTDDDFAVRYLKYSNPRHTANTLPNKLLDRAFSRKNIFSRKTFFSKYSKKKSFFYF